MARRLFTVPSFTPTATADTSALANATHMTVGAASATQLIYVTEIFVQGLGTDATKVNNNLFARNSTIGVTPTALAAPNSDGPGSGATAALAAPTLTYVAAATPPQRSAVTTAAKLALSINCGGGIARWKPADWSEAWMILGTSVNISESSLSASTAAGTTSAAQSATIQYETLAVLAVTFMTGAAFALASLGSVVSGIVA